MGEIFQDYDKYSHGSGTDHQLSLVGCAFKGFRDAATEAIDSPGQTACSIALSAAAGFALSKMAPAKGLAGSAARAISVGCGLSFAKDIALHGKEIASVLTDPSHSYETNAAILEQHCGRFAFDSVLMSAGAYAGGHFAAPSRAVGSRSDNLAGNKYSTDKGEFGSAREGMWRSFGEMLGLREGVAPPSLTDSSQKVAMDVGLKLPSLSPRQSDLAVGQITVAPDARDTRGLMGCREKYLTVSTQPDGSEIPVMVRLFDKWEWNPYERCQKEMFAHWVSPKLGFEGFPASIPKVVEVNGAPRRAWVQELCGEPMGFELPALAKTRYGGNGTLNVLKLINEDPVIRSSVEKVLLERLVYRDTDPHAHNVMMTKPSELPGVGIKFKNIDLDLSFKTSPDPDMSMLPGYGLNYWLYGDFANKPISPEILQSFRSFRGTYDSPVGKVELVDRGLSKMQTWGFMRRLSWFTRHQTFPDLPQVTVQ